jgi:hypothetical protein
MPETESKPKEQQPTFAPRVVPAGARVGFFERGRQRELVATKDGSRWTITPSTAREAAELDSYGYREAKAKEGSARNDETAQGGSKE